jgi:starch synthase
MTPLRICLVASELTPFAKTGGLGDVAGSLARYLHAAGHDVRPFLPLYGNLNRSGRTFAPVAFLQDVPVTLGARRLTFSVQTAPHPTGGVPIYFVACPELYARPSIYSSEGDEHLRFALLSHAALISCQRMGFAPHVVHCNDWHTALIPLWLRTVYGWDELFAATKTVLTIHNLAYQGAFPASVLPELSLTEHARLLPREDVRAGRVGFLATGILHADAVTAVSRTYAREILTPEHGMGLDRLLRSRLEHLHGIVNGIDDDVWNPSRDPHIAARYSAADLAGKAACRRALLAEAGLAPDPKGPVFAVVSRLTAQKGLDLVPPAIAAALERDDARLVALGSGSDAIAERFRALERRFRRQVSFLHGYDEPLAHRIEAGADAFLMPSVFEPCGLNQMYSLAYGTVPIVRRTGGLADTVRCWDPATGRGTGLVFEHADAAGLRWGIDTAVRLFRDRATWRSIQVQGMAEDNGWTSRIGEYVALYRGLGGRG